MQVRQALITALVAFVFQPESFAQNYSCRTFSLDEIPSGSVATFLALNDSQTIVGSNFVRAASGTVITIAFPGARSTAIGGINNKGDVSGTYYDTNNQPHLFIRYADNNFVTVPTALNGTSVYSLQAGGIAENGTVAALANSQTLIAQTPDATLLFTANDYSLGLAGAAVGPINSAGQVLFNNLSYGGAGIATNSGVQSTGYPLFLSYVGGLNNTGTTAGFFEPYTQGAHQQGPIFSYIHPPNSSAYPIVVCPGYDTDGFENMTRSFALSASGLVAGTLTHQGTKLGFIATPSGTSPKLQVSDDHWSFEATRIGQTASLADFYIRNEGSGPLHIPNLTKLPITGPDSSDFSITENTCPAAVEPGGWCAVTVQFKPSAPGNRTATLLLASDSPTSPLRIPLTGVGLGASLQFSTTTAGFGVGFLGSQSSPANIYAYANGGQPITFTSISITGLNASDYVIVGNTCGNRVPAYTTCMVNVAFAAKAIGERIANLTFVDNAQSSPTQIGLTGYGLQ